MTISAQISTNFSAKYTGSAASLTLASGVNSVPSFSNNYEDGTGAGKVNKEVFFFRTITAGSNWDLDLTSGLTDVENNSVVFTGIKELLIGVISADWTKKVKWGAAASNSWQGSLSAGATQDVYSTYRHPPKADAGGWTVDGTHKTLRLNNPGASDIQVFLIILGIG